MTTDQRSAFAMNEITYYCAAVNCTIYALGIPRAFARYSLTALLMCHFEGYPVLISFFLPISANPCLRILNIAGIVLAENWRSLQLICLSGGDILLVIGVFKLGSDTSASYFSISRTRFQAFN